MVEPGQTYVFNWHIAALCDHLEAAYVSEGVASGDEIVPAMLRKWGSSQLFRILGNVPPGTMKSLLVSVFFPAWVWGPMAKPHKRFLSTSHSERLAIRDTMKCRRLVKSKWFQRRWPVALTADQDTKGKFENSATGFRQGVPFRSMTGERADFVILDDPMSVADAMSDADRDSANTTFRESLSTRLNNPEWSVIIVIMQRLHEDDTSGLILSDPEHLGYQHLMLPMRFDPDRRCETSIGFVDPREIEGELLFPARFPLATVDQLERDMGPSATSGQMQQSPRARGAEIIRREYWQPWEQASNPRYEYVIVSVDTAYSEKEENDPSACTVWGVFRDGHGHPKLMLIWSWELFKPLHGQLPRPNPGESDAAFAERSRPYWGLVEWIAWTCREYRRFVPDGGMTVLIEGKASGQSVAQEIQRLYADEFWRVILTNPTHDKVARAHAAEPCFAADLIYAPVPVGKDGQPTGKEFDWVEKVMAQCETFPRSKRKDLVDTVSQAVTWARSQGLLQTAREASADYLAAAMHQSPVKPLYDA